jgi:hypothetical protein
MSGEDSPPEVQDWRSPELQTPGGAGATTTTSGGTTPAATTSSVTQTPSVAPGTVGSMTTTPGPPPRPPPPPPALLAVKRDASASAVEAGVYDNALQDYYPKKNEKSSIMWVYNVTKGLEDKFSVLKAESIESNQLETVYDVSMRMTELERKMRERGLYQVFEMYTVDNTVSPPSFVAKGNLFEVYTTMNLQQVRDSVRFIKDWWSQRHIVWGMTLTFTLLENSCDLELRGRVNETLMNIPEVERGGPVYLKIALDYITSVSYAVSLALTLKVQKLKIKDFDGEEVPKVVGFLRGALARLQGSSTMNKQDTIYQLFKIFQTTSNWKFNNWFANWYGNLQTQAMMNGVFDLSTMVKPEQIFTMANQQYMTLVEEGSYLPKRKTQTQQYKADGGKSGGTANAEESLTADVAGDGKPKRLPPWKKPPGKGEPHKRQYKDEDEWWCPTCKKWTRHDPKVEHSLNTTSDDCADLDGKDDAPHAKASLLPCGF